MIIDTIQNAPKYYCHGGLVEEALRYLVETDFSKLALGEYKVHGDDIISKIRTFPDGGKDITKCGWEGHHEFMDIHYVLEGEERFGYAEIGQMKETFYNTENDTADFEGEGTIFTLYPGMFALVDLNDIHLPATRDRDLAPLRKVTLKVRVK